MAAAYPDGDGAAESRTWLRAEEEKEVFGEENHGMKNMDFDRENSPSREKTATEKRSAFKSLKRSVTKGVTDFFLGDNYSSVDKVDSALAPDKWKSRCAMLHSNRLIGGKVNSSELSVDTVDGGIDSASQAGSVRGHHIVDPYKKPPPMTSRQDSRLSKSSKSFHFPSRQVSRVSTVSSSRRSTRQMPRKVSRKDSVIHMAYGGIKDWMTGSKKSKRHPLMHSRSFAPASVTDYYPDDSDTIKTSRRRSPAADSVFTSEDSWLGPDDVFFGTPTPTSSLAAPFSHLRLQESGRDLPAEDQLSTIPERVSRGSDVTKSSGDTGESLMERVAVPEPVKEYMGSDTDTEPEVQIAVTGVDERDHGIMGRGEPLPSLSEPVEPMRPLKGGWRVGIKQPEPIDSKPEMGPDTPDFLDMPDGPFEAMDRIKDVIIDNVKDNSERRQIGRGIVGNMLDLQYRTDRMTSEIEAQIAGLDEHRPIFTYWVTFVQIVVYIISVSVYGIAPIGFEETRVYGEVKMPNLAVQVESYVEKDNLWIGPRQADLIHLGAKYSPCMRKDMHVEDAIAYDRTVESQTGCCIGNDGSGCVQTLEHECSSSLAEWHNWGRGAMLHSNRTSGPVCGTDPRKCKNPLSQGAGFEWEDNITKWPICIESVNVSSTDVSVPHLTCKVSGRPCCISIQGECLVTTREYCEFRKGFFHEEAFLCSQVSCMNEICGMITFLDPEVPDQFYRLWISLFLHAGLLQLIVTIVFQFFIMRDMEKLAGWHRIAIIYIGSGIAGSLSSAIFLPYHVEAGPAGAQFGIMGMLLAEIIQNFFILKHPWRAVGKLVGIILFLFVLGLLPYIDNYAHVIGLLFGFLLSFALLPYINFNKLETRGKIIGIVVCLLVSTGLFAVLIVLFYVSPVYNCPYCHYFNCIPFTPKFCETMEVSIRRSSMS